MELEIFWTQFAEDELYKIFKHYLTKAGQKIAKKLVNGIYKEPLILSNHPILGQVKRISKIEKLNFAIYFIKIITRSFIG